MRKGLVGPAAVAAAVILAATGPTGATGSSSIKIRDGVWIRDLVVIPDEARLRVSFRLENHGSFAVFVTGFGRTTGEAGRIMVGGAPLYPASPGVMARYGEMLDFSSSHLVAALGSENHGDRGAEHFVIELRIDGAAVPVSAHLEPPVR